MPKVRIEARLTDDQARAVQVAAAARGISIAEVIREALDQHLTTHSRRQRAVRAIGGYRSGRTDISISHDDAFEAVPST
ncbi:MAG TPA: ribbon-helix-helix protein, CopG family [Acidimicrobiales bacterium]|nr:ribbon-helix-helix protein, CopG family [Acidimicrobiales bacterium]